MEKERIITLFEKLFNGDPWIDVTIMDTLEKLSGPQAASKALPQCNSIWEIVNHMISWRKNVLQRIQGKTLTTPTNNYFEPIADPSQEAWIKTLEAFQQTQREWISFLEKFDIEAFETPYPSNGMTYFEHIHGIIQHDAYHLGQIVLLSKFVKTKM